MPIKYPIITPVKGEGSSYCKGKEIAVDDPATKIVGEDAPFSKSEHSKKEEGSHNPDSECAPLINPWYNTYMHFLVVPSGYLPSLAGHVWLSICRRDTEVS